MMQHSGKVAGWQVVDERLVRGPGRLVSQPQREPAFLMTTSNNQPE